MNSEVKIVEENIEDQEVTVQLEPGVTIRFCLSDNGKKLKSLRRSGPNEKQVDNAIKRAREIAFKHLYEMNKSAKT